MTSPRRTLFGLVLAFIIMACFTMAFTVIAHITGAKSTEKQSVPPDFKSTVPPVVEADANSESDGFTIDRIDCFRPGRLMDEIFRDIRWVGNFEMAAERQGKKLVAISFYVCLKGQRYGETLWAIFEDDRFVKFVGMSPDDTPDTIPIGTFKALDLAAGHKPIVIAEFKKEMEKNVRPEPHAPVFESPKLEPVIAKAVDAIKASMVENARLRDQFNAARLKLGMTRAEITATLRARPLESGDTNAGPFEIYGSTEYNDLVRPLQYKNILVLYHGDRLVGIYSGLAVPGTQAGLDLLREPSTDSNEVQHFTGLPPATHKVK